MRLKRFVEEYIQRFVDGVHPTVHHGLDNGLRVESCEYALRQDGICVECAERHWVADELVDSDLTLCAGKIGTALARVYTIMMFCRMVARVTDILVHDVCWCELHGPHGERVSRRSHNAQRVTR